MEYKGPLVAPYLESFVLRVITPLTYLSSTAALKDFLSHHEVLLLSSAAPESHPMQLRLLDRVCV